MPRQLLLHRAVAAEAIANEASVFAAPAHSDAASDYQDIGSMTVPCSHCGARFWRGEKIQCCYNGSLLIPEPDVPDSLSNIILSSAVRTHMRSYNMSMAMASVGHHKTGFPDGVFTISGRSFHRMGTLVPAIGQPPNFAQIYTVDTNVATDRRSEIFGDRLDRSVLRALHDQMLIHNRCVSEFCRVAATDVHELVWTTEDNIMGMQMGALVAVAGDKRSIVIKRQGNPRELHMINDGHPLYHTLAYPLLFPTGSPGWFCGMTRSSDDGSPPRLVSLHDYGRYILMHRERSETARLIQNNNNALDRPTHVQKCKQLALEFYCDLWAQNEARTACFHQLPAQQAKYRMGRKCALEDQISRGGNVDDASQPTILPSSFVGSAKWYHMLYLDALTLPQRYHCPDLFVTFTCNPKWPEILREIPRGADARDHPDIVARVFWLKYKSMMEDIVEHQIFGEVQGYVWRIEWQLRGLPHAHLLIILTKALRLPREIDAIISAEVPDPAMYPELFSIVSEFQVHTPCDRDECASCRDNDKKQCKRRFPKDMSRSTVIMGNKFPKYRRRGRYQCIIKDRIVSDDWVVPFSPFLSLKYRAHINVENSSSLKSFRYVYKYVLKPPDSAVIAINEIQAHLSGRLLSAAEAVWRLLNLPLHKEYPAVMRLHIHLPNEHTIIFDPTMDVDDIREAAAATTSTLLQWFDLNHRDASARALLYSEIPEHFVWHEGVWVRRRKSRQLGRIFAVAARNQELFALRRLLTVVRGATGWEDLLIVDGHCYDSFQAACAARGMLDDDGDIIAAFNDIASSSCSVVNNRQQFALLLVHRQCKNVPQFFAMMAPHLCDNEVVNPLNSAIALWSIEEIMLSFGRSLTDADYGVTLPPRPAHLPAPLSSSIQWPSFDQDDCISKRDESVALFTAEQHHALDSVLSAVRGDNLMNVFAVLASAGCGKTMWVQGLTWSLRAMGHHVLNVAASALAATLLPEGCTAHSAFRIPIPTTSASYCGVKGSARDMIRACKCICYDEVSMVGKDVAECLNRFLQDVMHSELPFGGKVVVFLGDFKQLTPVEPGRKYPATVKDCGWWSQCQLFRFTKNFRAAANADFCALMEQVGNGLLKQVPVPAASRVNDIAELISRVYGNDMTAVSSTRNLIMAFTLQTCNDINAACIAQVPGEGFEAPAYDDTRDNRQPELYTDDYLAKLPLNGVPPSTLIMKTGARYMIIKNYNPATGACNGTLCELLGFSRHLCHVKIQSGIHAGRVVMLPRCSCHVSRENSGLPFEFTRTQFPLILAYSVSVHKSQGQSLSKIGIAIDQESFAHGQVYTALSRTSGWDNICVLTLRDEDYITNKVHLHCL